MKKSEQSQIVVTDSLAVKYRPRKIEDMIGNQSAKTMITGMLKNKRFPNTILLHGGTGMGKCVTGDTLVSTTKGFIRASSLVEEKIFGFSDYKAKHVLLNQNFEPETPSHQFYDIADSVINIKTNSGLEITGTKEHPLLCYNPLDGFRFIKLGDIERGDYVVSKSEPINYKKYKDSKGTSESVIIQLYAYAAAIGVMRKKNIKFVTNNVELQGNIKKALIDLGFYKGELKVTKKIFNSNNTRFDQIPDFVLSNSYNIKEYIRHYLIASHITDNTHLATNKVCKEIFILLSNYFPDVELRGDFIVSKSPMLDDKNKPISYEEIVRFDPVVVINKINKKTEVFDVCMPVTHTFIANGMVNHNTTIARLLARYINCATGDACGVCPSCRSGDSNPDLVEMNMAETRGIDDIRNLINKSKLAPRFNQRIFILDELHQCFPADVEVLMANGLYKKISEIDAGDSVMSYNSSTLRIEAKTVEHTYEIQDESKELVDVITDKGKVTCTSDHRWWINSQRYMEAEFLVVDDALLAFDKSKHTVLTISNRRKSLESVYDITVSDNHNFFIKVGDSTALVHNCTPQAKEAMLKPLEEPPKRTMWILCTTNPEKLSKTIIGRCQQITVESPSVKEMTQYMIKIAKEEGLKLSKETDLPVFKHIAERSMGHSRNALQMLETYVAVKSSSETVNVEDILKSLAVTTEEDIEDISAHLISCILKGEGKEAVKLLFTLKDKDPFALLFKMRWLLEFKLNEWAGTMRFSPSINQMFLKYYGKVPVKTVHVIKVLNTLIDCEVAIKTVSGLDARMYFASKILNDMVQIVESKE